MKIKEKVTQEVAYAKIVLKNLQHLVEAVALLLLGSFTAYVVFEKVELHMAIKYTLLVSSAIVFVRGLYEFVKVLGERK